MEAAYQHLGLEIKVPQHRRQLSIFSPEDHNGD